MIERLTNPRPAQLDALMAIWLSGNLEAHAFVPAGYWRANAAAVRQALPVATLYVAAEAGRIVGFAGVQDGYVAGLFVAAQARDRGVGHQLVAVLQATYPRLTLHAFAQNRGAVRFYRREGFTVTQVQAAAELPDQAELEMTWMRP
ncbi:GNAT family N-acetyltransferase [Lacticaseibacillus parakribbianus]|uniref:GNAT family N-acetyltransferase n=1 Tax=Lacticaseibacillus parakribbianus TaxID=2970927 RepID=UPI0021CAF9DB|nr:GNAT family N-acetyltransferase [Lacticaseibacillus parakribbianus]